MTEKQLERRAQAVPARIRALRLANGQTLREVANLVGMAEHGLSEVETGKRWVGYYRSILALCDALGCQPEDLLLGQGE